MQKKNQNAKQKQVDMVLPLSLKVGLDNNCSMLNVYDVVPQNRRIYIYILYN